MNEIMTRLSADLKVAMKERNDIAIKTIRSLISEIDNAGAVKLPVSEGMVMSGGIAGATEGVGSAEAQRRALSSKDIEKILLNEINEIEKAEFLVEKSGTNTSEFKEQIKILKGYLV